MYSRKCPTCKNKITYKRKGDFNIAERKNSICKSHYQFKPNHGVSNKTRQKMSIALKGKQPWNKGISHSKETKQNISKSLIGRKNPSASFRKGKTYEELYGEQKAKQLKTLKLSSRYTFGFRPSYNKRACIYFNELMKQNNINIQHALNGGEFRIKQLGYFVDGYDKNNNVVYEWDEKYHFNKNGELKIKDLIRQRKIEQTLGCKVVRIKQSDIC